MGVSSNLMRDWLTRTYDYITYDWLITLIIAIGVVLVGLLAFGGGSSTAVMLTTLAVGLVMGMMVAARQRSLAARPKKRPARKRR